MLTKSLRYYSTNTSGNDEVANSSLESERMAAIQQFQILDTEEEEEYDNIVALAAQLCQVPLAAISFADKRRSWLKAKIGFNVSEVPSEHSLCSYALKHDYDPLIITNAFFDERFDDNPVVHGDRGIKFYAGFPLITDDGLTIGHLCVADYEERNLSTIQYAALRKLSRQVVSLLNLRLQLLRHKSREQELLKQQQSNVIFQNAIDAVIVLNEAGNIIQWNHKAETIFGWQQHEVVNRTFESMILDEQFQGIVTERISLFETLNNEDALNKTIEVTAVRKDGTRFEITLAISSTIINNEAYYICFVSDIKDRILVASKLDKQKEFYENILNNIPTDIAVFDADHKYIFVNPGAIKNEELRKYIIGKDDFEYAEFRNRDRSVAEKRREKFLEVKNLRKEMRWEDTLEDPNGKPVTHLRRLFPVHDENGQLDMVIGFGIDITERKVLEENQALLVNQLSAQNKQLVDFCNIVSHNLRAPLVNMSMLVKFIEETDDEEERKIMISMLNPVIDNLHTTFNELVESIQIKQDLEIESENINLEDCLKRTISSLDFGISEAKAVIESDFSEAPVIRFPAKYVYSIFHNLITNALKYHSPGRDPIIKLRSKKVGDNIIFSVTDNGLGINLSKHKDKIFKIGKVFHRNPNAKGFGLFMTKTQVEAMGGKIWVESTPGVGSTFFIEFKNQQ